MGKSLRRLSNRDYSAALAAIKKPDGRTNMVLYRLERGLILHYGGQYVESNREFEAAERLVEELYTRSAVREAAAMLTNDAIRPYRGDLFEHVLVHYYRAMNYEYLGQPEDALVECRKANLRLAQYAQVSDYEPTYKNDAFVQYVTGMLYEAEGELNDAYVSYTQAVSGYRGQSQVTGLRAPVDLQRDLQRVEAELGYAAPGSGKGGSTDGKTALAEGNGLQGIVVFVETGFVGRKRSSEVDLPILEGDDANDVDMVSRHLVYRYEHPYVYRRASVKYWLRVALPEYQPVPSRVAAVRVHGGGGAAEGVLVEDVSAIARQTFADQENTILARTAARALTKYLAARGVRKAFEDRGQDRDSQGGIANGRWRDGVGKLLGALVNLFGAATEAADTRSWLALPGRIYMARLPLAPGQVRLEVEFLDDSGRLVETQTLPALTVRRGTPTFVNCRGYL